MRRYIFILLMGLMVVLTYSNAFAEKDTSEWKDTLTTLRKLNITHTKDVDNALRLSRMDKKELSSELKSVSEKATKADIDLHQAIEKYNSLLEKEKKLTASLNSRKEEIKTFEGTVRNAAKMLQDRSRISFLTLQHPERTNIFATFLNTERMPGLADLNSLIQMYFEELAATGTITKYNGEIIQTDGNAATAEIIRVGTASAIYQSTTGAVGFLELTTDGTVAKSVSGVSSSLQSTIEDVFDGNSIVPLDFSHGAAFIRYVADKDLWTKISDGGMLVWPILGIGLIGLLLALERFFTLSRTKRFSPSEHSEILELIQKQDWDSCYQKLSKRNTPTGRVLWSTLKKGHGSTAALEKGMQEALLAELASLERFLPTMQTLAAVAPLLGLLGTVTGMINTFQIITLFGTGDPHMLSGGISEALVTTQLGLAVAIPIMLLHHILNSRVDRIVTEMEEKGTALIATILNER
ncbi:MotA/TolQ/ExbB proton channel family protein [Halodesulfovibrio aestuarii]|uniref:Biopolymer transport protein ExbB n=1 Tax=Halodesulfovibrio aestuarii TaxID=126333 RepID=A0A8G2CBH6_9BACT|nr:MotA/TolQ/ExbB proton channel family protein [Halodesulfovibrio aestuarii]SHJ56354.1 biopolymer transport protein ExbB [Halodesulfovibrio aestuarii]